MDKLEKVSQMSIQSAATATTTIPDNPSSVIETLKTGAKMNFITAQRERQQIKAKLAKTQLMYDETQLSRETQLKQIRERYGDTGSLLGQIELDKRARAKAEEEFDQELEDSMTKINEILDSYNELV